MPDSSSSNALTFGFSLVADRQIELRCGAQYRRIEAADLERLVEDCNRIYYAQVGHTYVEHPEKMVVLGQKLYDWLDGTEGWLRSRLGQGRLEIIFDLTSMVEQQRLQPILEGLTLMVAHLPWELLHDGMGYLLAGRKMAPPLRIVARRNGAESQPQNRPLQLLFMATSPEDVTELNFEQEEVKILMATEQQPLLLVTEESGSVAELGNLVQSYESGYFDVFNLTGHGIIYTAKECGNWVKTINPRAVLEENTPYFLTEDDLGQTCFSTVADLAGAFGDRFPKVIFLSGCHTGQVADGGAVPSMAQQLVAAGAEVVLGWARPVYDRTGILAAETLYQALAIGDPITVAIQKMMAALVEKECSDWHLLRVYRSARELSALVTPLNTAKRSKLKRRFAAQEFLGNEPVATAKEFVGRRRVLQRSLRALLPTSDRMGVFLHGMGGLGKSSVCARLCDRIQAQRSAWRRVVIYGTLDEAILLRTLEETYGDCAGVTEALNSKLKLGGRLQNFFKLVETEIGQPLLLVLDDLEQNIAEANILDGSLTLVSNASDVLAALGRGLKDRESRLLVTCRYDCPLPQTLELYGEQLQGMKAGDVRKQCQRLDLKSSEALTERLVKIADGNPRLLKWLSEVATAEDWAEIDLADLLVRLESVETKFRENLLLATLLEALEDSEQKALARLSVVQVPIAQQLVMELEPELDLGKLTALTLLEPGQGMDGPEYRVPSVVGKELQAQMAGEDYLAAQKRSTQLLHRVWWEEPKDGCNTDCALEILRLGLASQEYEIAVTVGDSMATSRVNNSRFVEAQDICERILAVHEDYRIFGTIARAQVVQGETDIGVANYQKALDLCPENDLKERTATLSNMAGVIAQQGDIDRALGLWAESLEILERIGDVQGKAATLNNMAGVIAQQGDIDRALGLWAESLEILERIGDVKGKAATLNNMAGVIAQQGDIDRALGLWAESLEIKERIGDVQGKAATLANVAGVLAGRGEFDTAIAYLEESVVLLEKIRDIRSTQVRQMLEQTRQMQQMSQSPFGEMLMGLMAKVSQNPELQAAMQNENTEGIDLESLLEGIDLEALRAMVSDTQEE
jgi:tetratricopeptide (TPR) repeat protein